MRAGARLGKFRFWIVAVSMACSTLHPAAWAAAKMRGPEFHVNSYTTGPQLLPSVGVFDSGDFLVVWESAHDGSDWGIFGQHFDSTGRKAGSEFLINTYTADFQGLPSLGVAPSRQFVVVWQSRYQDGSEWGVFGQMFDAPGSRAGPEFMINSFTTGWQITPAVGVSETGEFVVVWSSEYQDGSGLGIFGQMFDSAGLRWGGEFQINTYTEGDQMSPSVDVLHSGEFVVVWESESQDASGFGVFGQKFNSDGSRWGGEFRINNHTPSHQRSASVKSFRSGEFIVAWSGVDAGSFNAVTAQKFDRSGLEAGPELTLNSHSLPGQLQVGHAGIGVSGQGEVAVVWHRADATEGEIHARVLDGMGTRLGRELTVNTHTSGIQHYPALGMSRSGNFVVAWTSGTWQYGDVRNGHMHEIFGQRFVGDVDGDGLSNTHDIVLVKPFEGGEVDCRTPRKTDSRPRILWDRGMYDRFRVQLSGNRTFPGNSRIDSGRTLLTKRWWRPPAKKWRRLCRQSNGEIFIRVYGVNLNANRQSAWRRTFSQVVRTDPVR